MKNGTLYATTNILNVLAHLASALGDVTLTKLILAHTIDVVCIFCNMWIFDYLVE